MPPKQAKKGDQEDFSDVPTLPKVNVYKFGILLKQFFAKEIRDRVQKIIQTNLVATSSQKVKPLTREEITAYGTSKGHIMSHDAIKNLPEDDPRKLLTDEDMLAKSAADKLFELTVNARRERKDKVAKIEAEIQALTAQGKDASHLSLESENADVMFYLIDYPNSKKEALAMSKYGHSLNCVFEVEEVAAVEEQDDSDATKKFLYIPEELRQGPADEGDEAAKARNVSIGLREAKFVCSIRSPLRQLAFIKVPFMDRREIIQTTDKDGVLQEKIRLPEEAFLSQLYFKFIDKYNQYYFQYLKFRSRVDQLPLMPDPQLLSEIRALEREGFEIQQFFEDANAKMNDEASALDKTKPETSQVEFQRETDTALSRHLTTRGDMQDRERHRQEELRRLKRDLKVSLDDERDYSKFKIDAYKSDFIDNKESANNISSVLSAMITQIEENHKEPWTLQPERLNSLEVETAADTIDDLFEKFNYEISCDLKLQDRGLDPIKNFNPSDTLSSKIKLGGNMQITEEFDRTKEISQTLPAKLIEKEGDRAALIAQRQAKVLSNLNLPGKNRHLMPAIPAKSQRKRDAENAGFYPFCQLAITDAERMLMLKQLQQLVKSNFIDQGVSSSKRHNKYKVFERSFQNYMTPEIFCQVFNDALLDKPEMASLYYARTDSLLVALFNRVSKKETNETTESAVDTPEFYLGEYLDGQTKWQAPYRVMPDFQNWLAYFAEEVLHGEEIAVPLEPEEKPEEKQKEAPKGGKAAAKVEVVEDPTPPLTINVMKYSLNEEMMPENLLNIEDDKIQSIQENSASLFPDDNSIMRVDHFTVGGNFFSKSIVQKDNFKFGLRQKEPNDEQEQEADDSSNEDDTENGLVAYKATGDSEFWLHFENGTKLSVEQVKLRRNPQKTIRIDPKPFTSEELVAKEEAIKQWQAAVTKAQKQKQPIPTMDDFNIPKTPQPRWETRPLNFLDELFQDDVLEQSQSLATITLKNGLIIQYLGTGHVMQINEEKAQGKIGEGQEVNRVVSKDGVVIRQFQNHDAQVLFSDGVCAKFNKKRMEWILINNLGKARSFKDGVLTDLEYVPTAVESDQATGAQMMIREDGVVTVAYPDGSLFCQHQDGTKMHTSADGSEIRIEKKNYASHTIKIGKSQSQPNDEKFKNVFQRAIDNTVLETYLPDGSMTQTFADVVNNKKDEPQQRYRHLIRRSDLSIVVVDSSGHISVITSNARAAMNENGRKSKLGADEKDIDYLVELSRRPGEYSPQVYQAYISAKEGKSKIKTKNTRDDTIFELSCDHTLHKILGAEVQKSPLLNKRKKRIAEADNVENQQPSKLLGEMELEETGQWEEPFEKYFKYPRFFVIANNGSAKELLSPAQLEYSMRTKKVQADQSIKQKMADVVNNVQLGSHYFLTKVINMNQIQIESQQLDMIDLPQNAAEVLNDNRPIELLPELQLQVPLQEQYLYQQIFQMPPCDLFSQQAFANDYLRYREWQMQQVRYDTEFAIVHKIGGKDGIDPRQLEDDLFVNKRINKLILKHRAQPKQEFNPEEFKQQAFKDMALSGDVQAFRRSTTMNRSVGSSQDKHKRSRSQGGCSLPDAQLKNKLNKSAEKRASRGSENSSVGLISEEEDYKSPNRMQNKQARSNLNNVRHLFQQVTEKRRQKKEIPPFIKDYFSSQHAAHFCQENPLTKPTDEVMLRMQQRIERSKNPDTSAPKSNLNQNGNDSDALDNKNNPIVALEPDELKQASNFLGGSKKGQSTSMLQPGEASTQKEAQETGPLPSLYLQEKIYLYNKDQEALLKAEEHHIVKTKDFNVYGRLREEKPFVKSIAKSKAATELNEKFITTECITDRRVKISSMAPRFYVNAPSVEDVRKQGQHQMILSAINKKQTFAELINQANSMVTGVLHDTLKRSLNIMPHVITFGALRQGSVNEVILTIKNEDSIGHRITVKPIKDNRIVVQQQEYGIIAPGMIKKISVIIRVGEDEQTPAAVKETLKILSKHDVFNIPISAHVLSTEAFDQQNRTNLEQTGKSIQNSRVREKLNRAVANSRHSNRSNDPEILTKKPRDKSREDDSIGAPSIGKVSNNLQSKSLHSNK